MSSDAEKIMHKSPAESRVRGRSRLLLVGVIAAIVIAGIAVYSANKVEVPPRITLAIVTNNNDTYWNNIIRGAQDAAHKLDVDLIVVHSNSGPVAQSEQIEQAVSKGASGVAVSVRDPSVQHMSLNEVATRVPLITLESDAPASKRILFVGTDNYSAGQRAAQQVREALPDGGEVIITVGSVDFLNARERRQGVIDDLLSRGFDRETPFDELNAPLVGKKYSIIETVVHGNDATKATPKLVEAITAHPTVNCIVGLYGYSTPAVLRALEQTGKTGKIKVIGFDDFEETKAGIRNGTVASSILQDDYQCGFQAVSLLADLVRNKGNHVPSGLRMFYTGISVLRAENVTAAGNSTQPTEPTTRAAATTK